MSRRKTAMVVLASKELWPNIQGLVYWHEHQGGLEHLFIYQTSDEERSRKPAQGLRRLCEALYGQDIRVHVAEPLSHEGGGDRSMLPQVVREQIEIWRRQVPDHDLVINATGGLKLMFAGVLDCLHLERTQVVYRELGQQCWYRLELKGDVPHAERFEVPLDVTNHIPVDKLVSCQWPGEGEWGVRSVEPLPVDQLVDAGFAHEWNWKDTFRACHLPHEENDGFLFERFVAAAILELGVQQVGVNAELWRLVEPPQDEPCNPVKSVDVKVAHALDDVPLVEVDIVANYGGRLLVVDCKLRCAQDKQAGKIMWQILQAAQIRAGLGGQGAKIALVRPNDTVSARQRLLAKWLHVDVLDKRNMFDFFTELQAFFGLSGPLPPALARAQDRLHVAKRSGVWSVFARSKKRRPREPTDQHSTET